MRKIMSQEEEGKKRKRNQIIVGLILVGLMLVSTLGYAFQSQDTTNSAQKISYKGYEFVNSNGLWVLALGGLQFSFLYSPNLAEKSDSSVNLLNSYVGKPLYVSSQSYEAEQELYRNLDQIVLRRQYACLEGTACADESLPEKTCSDNFIIIEINESASIEQSQNCLFIRGQSYDLARIADGAMLKILGVD